MGMFPESGHIFGDEFMVNNIGLRQFFLRWDQGQSSIDILLEHFCEEVQLSRKSNDRVIPLFKLPHTKLALFLGLNLSFFKLFLNMFFNML